MNLENQINIIEQTPLTINNLLEFNYPVKTNAILYNKIRQKYNTIDELFQNNKAIILLINKGSNLGHFCGLLKKNNIIEFFGPYGYTINKIINILGINDNILDELFKKSKYTIIYNKYQYEVENNKIETCGLHVIMRIIKYNLSNEEYHKFLKYKNLKPDEIVSLLTYVTLL